MSTQGEKITASILKVLRQCPLILLAEVMYMVGVNFYDVGRVAL
jgi:hypothetical protein